MNNCKQSPEDFKRFLLEVLNSIIVISVVLLMLFAVLITAFAIGSKILNLLGF